MVMAKSGLCAHFFVPIIGLSLSYLWLVCFTFFSTKNLRISKKSSTFAAALRSASRRSCTANDIKEVLKI